jgi:hypothetical protein
MSESSKSFDEPRRLDQAWRDISRLSRPVLLPFSHRLFEVKN